MPHALRPRRGYTLIHLLLGLAAVAIVATAIVYTAQRFSKQPAPAANTNAVACTADAKQCPDGSSVSRVPPSCEFAACPGEYQDSNRSDGALLDEYSYREIAPSDPLCATLEIYNHDRGEALPGSKLRICEDNVQTFSTVNGVIMLTTQAGRQYTRNLSTGEEKVTEPRERTGIGGLFIIK